MIWASLRPSYCHPLSSRQWVTTTHRSRAFPEPFWMNTTECLESKWSKWEVMWTVKPWRSRSASSTMSSTALESTLLSKNSSRWSTHFLSYVTSLGSPFCRTCSVVSALALLGWVLCGKMCSIYSKWELVRPHLHSRLALRPGTTLCLLEEIMFLTQILHISHWSLLDGRVKNWELVLHTGNPSSQEVNQNKQTKKLKAFF